MWYETEVHRGIDWHCIAVDGFRPKGKSLKRILENAGSEGRYKGLRADKAYCNDAKDIRTQFHQRSKCRDQAMDDKCLAHFIVPWREFSLDYEGIHGEMLPDKSNYPSAYRILIFQFPKGSCSVDEECMRNVIERTQFRSNELYKNLIECQMDLQYLINTEIRDSLCNVLSRHMKGWDHYSANYMDVWPRYRDFSFAAFEKWYLAFITDNQAHKTYTSLVL